MGKEGSYVYKVITHKGLGHIVDQVIESKDE
jgi:hypothetical protein